MSRFHLSLERHVSGWTGTEIAALVARDNLESPELSVLVLNRRQVLGAAEESGIS